jgi:hypothetical protein
MKKLLCAIALTAAFALGSPLLKADILTFSGVLTPDQETPPTESTAVAVGVIVWDTGTGKFTVGLTFSGLTTNANAAHIHMGPPGMSGGIVIRPWDGVVPSQMSGFLPSPIDITNQVTPELLNDLQSGNLYFNIHTQQYPGGEIRGQIYPDF